jgi:hypothetical protein
MDPSETYPTFASTHTTEECIRLLDYMDLQRSKLGRNKHLFGLFRLCKKVIWTLVYKFNVDKMAAAHAVALVQRFIVVMFLDRKFKIPSEDTGMVFVSCSCFSLSLAFFHCRQPHLESMLEICCNPKYQFVSIIEAKRMFARSVVGTAVEVYSSATKRKFNWKELQLQILSVVEWKLFFPTGFNIFYPICQHYWLTTPFAAIDLYDCMRTVPEYQNTLAGILNKHDVYYGICLVMVDCDMLQTPSHAIVIASIAAVLRLSSGSDGFDAIFNHMSILDPSISFTSCCENIFQKLCMVLDMDSNRDTEPPAARQLKRRRED